MNLLTYFPEKAQRDSKRARVETTYFPQRGSKRRPVGSNSRDKRSKPELEHRTQDQPCYRTR